MLKPILTALTLSAALSGCATIRDSAVNPANWFGRGQEAPAPAPDSGGEVNTLIPTSTGLFGRVRAQRAEQRVTSPIDQITSVQVERVPGGAIIRATGVDARQGVYGAELLPSNEDELPENGVLTYTFERQLPAASPAGGPLNARQITVARHVTDQTLRGVRTIRVEGAQNALASRR